MGSSCSNVVVSTSECRRCINAENSAPASNAKLVESARLGDPQGIYLALKEGASVNAPDAHGWLALHYGSASGNLQVCKALLEQCSDVNCTLNDFSTPLMLAVEEGHLAVAKLLLENGALPWCKDETGFTAQDRCDKTIQPDLAKLLASPTSDSYRKVNGTKV
eukprot:TRINITY_DN17881_c0_g1_i1.p1 TRINITY_DN17881_c0_g1~~TRINITY_DN17881_c0_g1_i1.p1  ORF type:complete len:163 (+),score=37.00 TRINITY_DN17881_c0_g1_i1:165-653(+)